VRIIVQKFGGTSVADAAKIKNVAKRVVRAHEEGYSVVVVVSAMGDTTDRLEQLAYEISANPPDRELDMLKSTGEQVSIALLAMAVSGLGYQAISLTGTQVGIITDGFYSQARIKSINRERILPELDRGKIVILAGFQGVTINNEITTLGRGASDTTAVAIAATLSADRCDIYTDVDGVYTADPRVVPDARKFGQITYDEMLEMARLGAKVLHSRSVELAKKFNVHLCVRSSFSEAEGTMVIKEDEMIEEVVVSAVTSDRDQAKVSLLGVPDTPGIAAQIFQEIADANISIDMIIQTANQGGTADVSFTVAEKDLQATVKISERLKSQIGFASASTDKNIALVSLVGIGMKSHVGIAARMFRALADEGINIQMISTSEITISCVIDEQETERGVCAIHNKFELGGASS
jgi:aspartate kinase